MSDSRSYSSQVKPEHLTSLKVVEGAAAELRRAYAERADAMREATRAGVSLENIGRAAGLTRELVRQILAGFLEGADSDRHAGVEEPDHVG
jgi:DNA-directed RNA polymerase sigma subunit (sigma70/sigma32)